MSMLATCCTALLGAAIGAWLVELRRRRWQLPTRWMQLAQVRIDAAGTVLSWHGADVELLGYSGKELHGRNIAALMPGHVADEHDGYLRRYAASLAEAPRQSRVLGVSRLVHAQHRAGHLVPLLLFVRPLRRRGRFCFEGILQALPAAGGGDFATVDEGRAPEVSWRWLRNFGHEVRTPMAAILGHAEILVDPGSDAAERQASASAVLGNSRHLMELLNDLLDHARVAAGRQALRADRLNVREVLQDVAAMVRPHAEHKGLRFDVVTDDAVPTTMHGDALRIRQILLNLLGNAMKFTDQGFVRLEVAARRLGRRAMLRIEVVDSGRGIDRAFLEHLFEPFQQEQRTQSGLQGSGLGLSIGRRLARLMGGELSLVDSMPGGGARFRLEIPVVGEPVTPAEELPQREPEGPAPPVAPAAALTEALPPVLRGTRILVVDDARDVLLVSRRFLEAAGAEVLAYDHAPTALAAVQDGCAFDSAVLDLRMPELSGFELARHLREGGFQGPILAVSADDDAQVLARCASVGIDRLIAKPFRREQLLDAVCAGREEAASLVIAPD